MARPTPCIGCGLELDESDALVVKYADPFDCVDGELTLKLHESLEVNGSGDLAVVPSEDSAYILHSGYGVSETAVGGSLASGIFTPGVATLMTPTTLVAGLVNPSATRSCQFRVQGGFDGANWPSQVGTSEAHLLLQISYDLSTYFVAAVTSSRANADGSIGTNYSRQTDLVFTVPPGWVGGLAGTISSFWSGNAPAFVQATEITVVYEYHLL